MDAPEDCLDADGVLDVDGVDVSDGFNLVVGASEVPPEFAPAGSLSKWKTQLRDSKQLCGNTCGKVLRGLLITPACLCLCCVL